MLRPLRPSMTSLSRPGSDIGALQSRLHAPVSAPTIAATASSLGRETEDLRLANLSARVAAAARRVASGQSLDLQRDKPVLVEAERILRTGAAALEGEPSSLPDYHDATKTSYAFARLTNSVLNAPPRRPDEHDGHAARRAAASTLLELAGRIHTILTDGNSSPDLRQTAEQIEEIFSRISGAVLSALGRPGDSLAGADPRRRPT